MKRKQGRPITELAAQRRLDVLWLVDHGEPYKNIASVLGLSISHVWQIRDEIKTALGGGTWNDITARAGELGLMRSTLAAALGQSARETWRWASVSKR